MASSSSFPSRALLTGVPSPCRATVAERFRSLLASSSAATPSSSSSSPFSGRAGCRKYKREESTSKAFSSTSAAASTRARTKGYADHTRGKTRTSNSTNKKGTGEDTTQQTSSIASKVTSMRVNTVQDYLRLGTEPDYRGLVQECLVVGKKLLLELQAKGFHPKELLLPLKDHRRKPILDGNKSSADKGEQEGSNSSRPLLGEKAHERRKHRLQALLDDYGRKEASRGSASSRVRAPTEDEEPRKVVVDKLARRAQENEELLRSQFPQTEKFLRVEDKPLRRIAQMRDYKNERVARLPIPAGDSLPHLPHPKLVLALENITDAGELGTILRSALAFQWHGVFFVGTKNADPWSPECIRASQGAMWSLPYMRSTNLEKFHHTYCKEKALEKDKLALLVMKEEEFDMGEEFLHAGGEDHQAQGMQTVGNESKTKGNINNLRPLRLHRLKVRDFLSPRSSTTGEQDDPHAAFGSTMASAIPGKSSAKKLTSTAELASKVHFLDDRSKLGAAFEGVVLHLRGRTATGKAPNHFIRVTPSSSSIIDASASMSSTDEGGSITRCGSAVTSSFTPTLPLAVQASMLLYQIRTKLLPHAPQTGHIA